MSGDLTHLPKRVTRLAALARLRLIWENYAPKLALPVLAVSLFLIVTWLGLWEVVGDPLRLIALLSVIGVLGRGLWQCRDVRWPSRSDALRRLETTAGLSHRPLDTITDHAVLSPDLWPNHVKQARAESERIKQVGRVPALSPLDRYGLRVIVPLVLIVALVLSAGFSWERTRHALQVTWLSPTNPYDLTFEAWVDPPDYTGRPPIYAKGTGPIQAPEGSTLVVRASGAKNLPRPRFVEDGQTRFLTVRSLGQRSLDVRTEIQAPAVLSWRVGPRLQQFTIETSPDLPPEIAVPEPTETDKRDRLVVSFNASDDYGVDRVLLEMTELTDDLDTDNYFASGTTESDTGSPPFKIAEGRTLKLDLTRHPLAGRKVVGRLVAVDGAGQRGVSGPLFFTVPDKIFVEPLAKAIAEQRTLLMAGVEEGAYTPPPKQRPDMDASDGTFDTYQEAWRLGRAPAPVKRTAELIEAVTDYPTPSLFNDPVVYMGLRHVGKTLRYARSAEALTGLPDHMWELAIRAEFGVLGTALQEMQEAEAALREGIARRAPEREIDTLFDRYNQAVDNYMEELRRNAEVVDGGDGGGGGEPAGSVDEIQALLDAIEEANARGDTEGARRALAQLAQLLENLQIQLTQGGGGGSSDGSSSGELTEEQREALEDLAELLGEQRELQDETAQSEREEQSSGGGQGEGEDQSQGSQSPEELARQQAELSDLLEQLEQQGGSDPGRSSDQGNGEEEGSEAFGGGESIAELLEDLRAGGGEGDEAAADAIGEGLEQAAQAMRESEDALRQGDLTGSRQAQDEAIRALRQAGEALAEVANTDDQRGDGSDPLGRSPDGLNADNSEADIDEKDNATRSREILEELRRRAAEAERDQQEREYLDRLLKRF